MGIKSAPAVRDGEAAKATCGCRCILCKSPDLLSTRVGHVEADGYCDMHHTCGACGAHFDHLEGVVFDACDACGYDGTAGGVAGAAKGGPAGPPAACASQ